MYLSWKLASSDLLQRLVSKGNYWNIIPIILGFMTFTHLTRRSAWLVRFPLTFVLVW